jgi:DNA modification methylase
MIDLFQGDFRNALKYIEPTEMIFADPPDNIKLGYAGYDDNMPKDEYSNLLWNIINHGTKWANVLWISYNAAHTYLMGHLIHSFLGNNDDWEAALRPDLHLRAA